MPTFTAEEFIASAGTPLSEPDIAARFTGKSDWKMRLPEVLQTQVALERAIAESH